MRLSVIALYLVLIAAAFCSAENWPEFRGPGAEGHASDASVPIEFSESENAVWRADIPGTGWSSPVVWGDQIWLTTALTDEVTDPKSDERMQEKAPIPRSLANNLRMHAVCIDRNTGDIVHNIELMTEPKPLPLHTMNSYASPTPVVEDGRVYCSFGANGTACVDTASGEIVWVNRELVIDHGTGAGSSPIVYGDLFIIHCDGKDAQYIAALDKRTGKQVWKTKRTGKMADHPEMRKSFGTPIVVQRENKADVLVSPAANWLYGYNPETGEELWSYPYGMLGFSNVPRPVTTDDKMFICTGFMKSQLQALHFENADYTGEPELTWSYQKQVPSVSSPLLIGDELYMVSDNDGIFTCVDAKTGEMLWRERLGGKHAASPLFAGGVIVVADRDGKVDMIKPGRKYESLSVNKLPDGILASPIAVDGSLFIRTEKSLYRFDS